MSALRRADIPACYTHRRYPYAALGLPARSRRQSDRGIQRGEGFGSARSL